MRRDGPDFATPAPGEILDAAGGLRPAGHRALDAHPLREPPGLVRTP